MRLYQPTFLCACLTLLFSNGTNTFARSNEADRNFSDFYELEPIQVVGEEIPITVFARNSGDRRYATKFAHKVVEIAYETIEKSPGSGLVIIGRSGELHPITLFEQFMERAQAEDAPEGFAEIADELERVMGEWREKLSFEVGSDENDEEEFPIDTDKLIDAFPIPLPGIGAKLYLLAWEENFEPESFEARLGALTANDLQTQEFDEFRWVFYLPPRNTLNKVIKEFLPVLFESEDFGPMKRMLARAAIATFKPLIKDAMEGVRKGILYWSVLQANEDSLGEGDLGLLASAYMESQMPKGKILGSNKQERALEAVSKQKVANAEYQKDPFVIPEPETEVDLSQFANLEGNYGDSGHRDKKFFFSGESAFWQEGDDEPVAFLPAGGSLFVSSEKDITIEFISGEGPNYPQVELRKGRFRHTFQPLKKEEDHLSKNGEDENSSS